MSTKNNAYIENLIAKGVSRGKAKDQLITELRNLAEQGYTRQQAADACGLTYNQLDYYTHHYFIKFSRTVKNPEPKPFIPAPARPETDSQPETKEQVQRAILKLSMQRVKLMGRVRKCDSLLERLTGTLETMEAPAQ